MKGYNPARRFRPIQYLRGIMTPSNTTSQSPVEISSNVHPPRSLTGSQSNPLKFMRSLWRILQGRPQVPTSLAHHALLDVIMKRRSVRSFSQREIADDVFAAILEAGRLAPSTVNLQSWSFAAFTVTSWRVAFDRP